MGKFGYDFYFKIGEEVLTLPITPSSLKMKIGSNNKVVTLINEGDINLLKSPSLVEFEFDARFPMRSYPYSREALNFETYLNKFTALKTDKQPFVFNVIRTTPDGKGTWATVRRVTLEDLDVSEDAEEGDDVIVSFKLKEYKEYGVVTHKQSTTPDTTSTSEKPRATDDKATKPETYTIKRGDTLWAIAKAKYGNGAKWTVIYEANKTAINEDARKHGKNDSSNGHWIYPNLQIVIPAVNGDKAVDTAPKKGKTPNDTTESPKTKYRTLTINCNGIHAYTGTIYVNYYVDGQKKTFRNDDTYVSSGVTYSAGNAQTFNGLKVQVDADTYTSVIVHPKDSSHGVVVSNKRGWTKHSSYKNSKNATAHQLVCENTNADLECTIKWIKNHQNLSTGA